jgi:hypothetical protein
MSTPEALGKRKRSAKGARKRRPTVTSKVSTESLQPPELSEQELDDFLNDISSMVGEDEGTMGLIATEASQSDDAYDIQSLLDHIETSELLESLTSKEWEDDMSASPVLDLSDFPDSEFDSLLSESADKDSDSSQQMCSIASTPSSTSQQEDQKNQQPHLLSALYGAINNHELPPRVVPNHHQQVDESRWSKTKNHDLRDATPIPIATSALLPEEDQYELSNSRMATESGRSMKKTADRIARGLNERTTKAQDASPASVAKSIQQQTLEDRFGDHTSQELFTAAHTIAGVHRLDQQSVRELIDPAAPILGQLLYERDRQQERSNRSSQDNANVSQKTSVPSSAIDAERLDKEIDVLLNNIKSQLDEHDSPSTFTPTTSTLTVPPSLSSSSNEPTAAENSIPAYSRSYFTDDETMEELNRALRQMANNMKQNTQMDPLRERHNTNAGIFRPATNDFLEKVLMEAPQPTPGQKSWEITRGVMLQHSICLTYSVWELYLTVPTRGQRPCSAGVQCLATKLYGVQGMPPLREFDALYLMEQMGEPECTMESLERSYEKRRQDTSNKFSKTPPHQLCILCLMYNIGKAHLKVLNSNTSLPSTPVQSSSTNGSSQALLPELNLSRIKVRIGPGEFAEQDCLFPSNTLYTGLLGPIPFITLFSFQEHERKENNTPIRALRYLGRAPEYDQSVGF